MKKLLLSMMVLVAGSMAANAAEVTIHFPTVFAPLLNGGSNVEAPATLEAEGFTMNINNNGASTKCKYYKWVNDTTQKDEGSLRFYAKNAMTLVAPAGGTITNVKFILGGGPWNHADSDAGYTVDAGTFTAGFTDKVQAKEATWTGSASEFTLTNVGGKNAAGKTPQLRIMSMIVTYTAGVETVCADPDFNLKDGVYFGKKTIKLTTNTDAATIMYSINGAAEQVYTEEGIVISEVGKYTITAYAKKEGLKNSATVTANYEIKAPVKVTGFGDLQFKGETEAPKTLFELDFPVTVVAQMPKYTYVKDGSGYMLIYGDQVPAYNVGDVIPAGIQAEYTIYNGLPEMTWPVAESFKAATEKQEVKYMSMKPSQINDYLLNMVVKFENVKYEGKKFIDTTDNTSIPAYFQKAWTEVKAPADGTMCDAVVAVAIYAPKGKTPIVQVYPIEFFAAGGVEGVVAEEVAINANAEGIVVTGEAAVVVYNAAGQVVAAAEVAGEETIEAPAGLYIVKANNQVKKVIVK